MAIDHGLVKKVAMRLYDASLRRIPEDTLQSLRGASRSDSVETARRTLAIQVASAEAAAATGHFVCSDAGIPTYLVKLGTGARLEGDVRRAFRDAFDDLARTIEPPLLQHVTDPLNLQRGYAGKDVPVVTFDLVDGDDCMDITCSPKALGSGRWGALEIFSFPSLATIEAFVMDVVLKAGSQHCPPVVVGIGIGGTMEFAAKLAKDAMLRPFGSGNPRAEAASLERRLLRAINATGFGPMGTGGDTTAMAVHVEYAAAHGFVPVAVEFNCWINRRTRARISNSGDVQWLQ